MSLNRSEMLIYDYLQAQPDELRHWQGVVTRAARLNQNPHLAANSIEQDLWSYYLERASVVEPFRGAARQHGLARTSMKNLAELLLRLWVPPTPKTIKPADPSP
ncbi:MAG: hypothetical protein RIQ79_902 [Verrucomicrobiota bacterium]|jgi:hypothetical protein